MSDTEIRRVVDRLLEQLRDEIGALKVGQARFERLAETYWRQICNLKAERDALQSRLNNLEALRCANPACQLCQMN